MNNNAHNILVSAIAEHGEKLATSDAYCKVYLSGYMVDHPAERKLLTALKQRELPKALITYLRMEMAEPDLHAFIKTLKQKLATDNDDLAWGIDAWASALSVPNSVRRNIREQFYLPASQSQEIDEKATSRHIDSGARAKQKLGTKNATKRRKGHALFPIGTMLLFGFIAFQLTGYIPTSEDHPRTAPLPEAPQVVSSMIPVVKAKPNNITLPSADVRKQTIEPRLITLKHTDKQDSQSDLAFHASVDTVAAHQPKIVQTPSRIQRNQQLDAHIAAFLKQK